MEINSNKVETVDSMGVRSAFNADTIILSVGRKSRINQELFIASKEVAKEVYIIGDTKQPRKIIDAVKEGFWTAVNI